MMNLRRLQKFYNLRLLSQLTIYRFRQENNSQNAPPPPVVDATLSNKNPYVTKTAKSSWINWAAVQSVQGIEGVVRRFNLPSEFKDSMFFMDQIQLHSKVLGLRESQLQGKSGELLESLQRSGIENIAKIKAACPFKKDAMFNRFCLSLFQAQEVLNKMIEIQDLPQIWSNYLIVSTLLTDKKPTSSFQAFIAKSISLDELQQCCETLLTNDSQDLLARLISMPQIEISKRDQLALEYYQKINPRELARLRSFELLLNIQTRVIELAKEKDGKGKEGVNVEQIISTRQTTLKCFLVMAGKEKQLELKVGLIKKTLGFAADKQISVDIQDLREFIQAIKGVKDEGDQSSTSAIDILEFLSGLPSAKSLKDEINQARQSLSSKITTSETTGQKEIPQASIRRFSEQLEDIFQEHDIQQHPSFQQLQEILKQSVSIQNNLKILLSVSKSNKIAAKMLLSKEIEQMIIDNIPFIDESSFSQVLFLLQSQVITSISLVALAERIKNSYKQFSDILLIQCFYELGSYQNQQQKRRYNQQQQDYQQNSLNDTTEAGKLKKEAVPINMQGLQKELFQEIEIRKSNLNRDSLNLLLKCLQFIKNPMELNNMQKFLLTELSERLTNKDFKCLNMYFMLIYHMISKEGMQSTFSHNCRDQLIEIFEKNNDLNLLDIDLFNFAQVLIALTKFGSAQKLVNYFFKRASLSELNNNSNQQSNEFRPDRLVFIYIALLKCASQPEHWKLVSEMENTILTVIKRNSSRQLAKENQVHLVQIVKTTHQLIQMYTQLDQQRLKFLAEMMNISVKLYPTKGDLGLGIWMFWQKCLVENDTKKLQEIFELIQPSIKIILEEAQNGLNSNNNNYNRNKGNVNLKKQRQDMKMVTEVSIVQFFQGILYLELNPAVSQQMRDQLEIIKNAMKNTKFFKFYKPAVTTRYSSNFESKIKSVLDNEIKTRKLTLICEKQLEDIFHVDLYIPEIKLAIECNGSQHYIHGELCFNDQIRQRYLESKGHQIEIIKSSTWNGLDADQKTQIIREIIVSRQQQQQQQSQQQQSQ